ncbi:APC5 protein [Oleoguttula sp. CCFEE 5521]
MARFLAPHKICLLVLVEAYLDAPPDAFYTALLLDNIATHLLPRSSAHGPDSSGSITLFCLPFKDLPSERPGCTFHDDFVNALWKAGSLDALQTLINRLHLAATSSAGLAQSRCSPGSPLGQFIRRSSVEWTRLPFDDSTSLLQAYHRFLRPTWEALIRRSPDTARMFLEARGGEVSSAAILDITDGRIHQGAASVSTGDLQAALGRSIDFLQRRGMRVPAALKSQLRTWLTQSGSQEAGTSSLRHFMAFFEAWRANQYSRALENLHRYFDYSIANKSAADGTDAGGSVKLYYQYALLHLSVLHADFEHWGESQAAMDECIATARENQDSECLTFALSWTLYLRQVHATKSSTSLPSRGEGSHGQSPHGELAFLKQRGKDSRQWSLVSSTLLEEAKLELRVGGVTPKAFEHLYQAAHLNVQHGNTALMCADAVFLAGLLERIGQTHTASRHCTAILAVLGERGNLRDVVRAKCRLAYGLALRGLYNEARDLIDDVMLRTVGSLKLQQRAEAFARLIALLRAIREGDLETAIALHRILTPMRDCGDPELSQHLDSLSAAFRHGSNIASAHSAQMPPPSNRPFTSSGDIDIAHRLQLMVQNASMLIQVHHGEQAMSIAIRAAAAAERALLMPVLLEAVLVITRILIALREFKGALQLCQASISRTMQVVGSSELCASLVAVCMEACVGLSGQQAADSKSMTSVIRASLSHCERAYEASALLKDRAAQIRMLVAKMALLGNPEDASALIDTRSRLQALLSQASRLKAARVSDFDVD